MKLSRICISATATMALLCAGAAYAAGDGTLPMICHGTDADGVIYEWYANSMAEASKNAPPGVIFGGKGFSCKILS